jgi:hypothetical protein
MACVFMLKKVIYVSKLQFLVGAVTSLFAIAVSDHLSNLPDVLLSGRLGLSLGVKWLEHEGYHFISIEYWSYKCVEL